MPRRITARALTVQPVAIWEEAPGGAVEFRQDGHRIRVYRMSDGYGRRTEIGSFTTSDLLKTDAGTRMSGTLLRQAAARWASDNLLATS